MSNGWRSVSRCSSALRPTRPSGCPTKSTTFADIRKGNSMNPNFAAMLEALPWIALLTVAGVGGWVFTTWLRIKNGYPLESSWGRPIHPHTDNESKERIKLLSSENAELRAQLGSVKD